MCDWLTAPTRSEACFISLWSEFKHADAKQGAHTIWNGTNTPGNTNEIQDEGSGMAGEHSLKHRRRRTQRGQIKGRRGGRNEGPGGLAGTAKIKKTAGTARQSENETKGGEKQSSEWHFEKRGYDAFIMIYDPTAGAL